MKKTYTHELEITTHYILGTDNAFNKDVMISRDRELVNRFIVLTFPVFNEQHYLNCLFAVKCERIEEYTECYSSPILNSSNFSRFLFQNCRSVFIEENTPHIIYKVQVSAKMYSEFNIDKDSSTNFDRGIIDTYYQNTFNPYATKCEVVNVTENDANFVAMHYPMIPML